MIILSAIAGAVATAFVIGAIVWIIAKISISFLKSYRKKKSSKILAARVGDLIKAQPIMKLDDLDDDNIILAEYDVENDELVQDIGIANDIDSKVSDILNNNEGIVVFD